MSFEKYITQELASLKSRLNAIAVNAKKIIEFPRQITLDPASLLHVSRGGISESIEIQQIINSISLGSYNQLLFVEEIILDVQEVTIPSGAQWIIGGVNYSTTADTIIEIPFCSTGLNRIDILVANQEGEIILVQGTETDSIALRPNIPVNTVLVTQLNVSDSAVGDPETPIIGTSFISKNEKGTQFISTSGLIASLGITEKSTIVFNGNATEFQGFIKTSEDLLYDGRIFHIVNKGSVDLQLNHLDSFGTLDCKFFNPTETDLVLAPNSIATYRYNALDSILELISNSQTTTYVDRFKGVYLTEAALNIAYPTANAGDRAQVNEVGATEVVNYSWDAESNIWVATGSSSGGPANTDELPEGSTNLYFTTARVLATVLTGISFATGGAIVSTDTVLVAFGKIQKQITDLSTVYQAILTDVNFGSFSNSLTSKATPVMADSINIVDSDDSNKAKKLFFTNLVSFLGNYFATTSNVLKVRWRARGDGSIDVLGSTLPTTTGTHTGLTSSGNANYDALLNRSRYKSASTAGSSCGFRDGSYRYYNFTKGFKISFIFVISDDTYVTGSRLFCGLYESGSVIGNVEPSTLVSIISIGKDSSDTNLQVIHNNGGASTKVDLGSNFPANTTFADMYKVTFEANAGGTSVNYTVKRFGTAFTATGTISTNINTSGSFAPHLWRNNGATASPVALTFYDLEADIKLD